MLTAGLAVRFVRSVTAKPFATLQLLSAEPRPALGCGLDAGPFLACEPPTNDVDLGVGSRSFHVRAAPQQLGR